jgi:hypothetical protein
MPTSSQNSGTITASLTSGPPESLPFTATVTSFVFFHFHLVAAVKYLSRLTFDICVFSLPFGCCGKIFEPSDI